MGACSHHFKKNWMKTLVILIYSFFALSILTSFFFPVRWLKVITNIWFGMALYIILTILIVDLIRILLKYVIPIDKEKLASKKLFVTTGTICVIFILAISTYGVLNAKHIREVSYDVSIEKKTEHIKTLKIALVADFHLGYNTGNFMMEQMVRKINEADVDLVVIAGDIFDNEYDAIEDPEKIIETLKGLKSTYGSYACYGNHDIEEKILAGFTFKQEGKKMSDPRMDELLEKSNILLLKDEGVLIENDFYLYGRPDKERPNRGITVRKTPSEITKDMDLSKPVILMDHEPAQLSELSKAGVDLDLAGHTHDGQMFPGNLTIKLMWENAYGLLKKGDMTNITTSGIGVFGPNMRVGANPEIAYVTVRFQ